MNPQAFTALLAILLFLVTPSPARASDEATVQRLNYSTLKKLILDEKIQSIDDLLPKLSPEYRGYFHLGYASKSLQYSSELYPRVILAGETGQFVMAFTGDPNQEGYETLELMEFDEPSERFVFREIVFPGKLPAAQSPRRVQFNEAPKNCKACHLDPARPNWDGYNGWPGFYGSLSRESMDGMLKGMPEEVNYLRFMGSNRKTGRYQHLPDEIARENPNLAPNSRLFTNAYEFSPNVSLLRKFSVLNGIRIKRIILDHLEKKPEFTTALFAMVQNICGKDPSLLLPAGWGGREFLDVAQEVMRLHDQDHQALKKEIETHNRGGQDLRRGGFEYFGSSVREVVAPLAFVLSKMGLDLWNWGMGRDMKLGRGVYNWSHPDTSAAHLQNIRDALNGRILGHAARLKLGSDCESWSQASRKALEAKYPGLNGIPKESPIEPSYREGYEP